ncbi:MAG: MarR family transcriptional regulator, partial [Bacteroidales bacterium]|nr:MarR family transcriptional regulator [Bacteroidales bacterium]
MEEDLKKESEIEGLSVKQLQCIELIYKMENPGLSELAEKLRITKPSVTAMIDKLEEHEYVLRVKSDFDRRSAHVHLTEKGKVAGQLHDKLHQKIARNLTKGLSESEKEIMVVLLNKAMQSLK